MVEDLHLSVLRDVFEDVKKSHETLTVNNYTINRDLIILFSPFLKDILASIPDFGSSNRVTITIPDVSIFSLMMVNELLLHGKCGIKTPADARDLYTTLRFLGIDVQRLESGNVDAEEIVINVAAESGQSNVNELQGKKVVFTFDENNGGGQQDDDDPHHNNSATASQKPAKPHFSRQSKLQIKKEMTTAEPEQPIFETPQQDPEPAPMDIETTTPQELQETETSQVKEPEACHKECQKCKKLFPTILMLKNHYCGHFLSILKKKFQSSYSGLNCLECNKSFTSVNNLLVHIGIVHDKINQVLKMKKIPELPPTEHINTHHEDIKNVPLVQPDTAPTQSQRPDPAASAPLQATKTPSAPAEAAAGDTELPAPPQTPVRRLKESNTPAPVPEKRSLDQECNFTQECQVCLLLINCRACYLSIRAKLYLLRYIHNSLNKILCTSQFS